MNIKDNDLERRFIKFSQETSKHDFNNVNFLKKSSKELMKSDPELAMRLLLRVKRLNKNIRPRTLLVVKGRITNLDWINRYPSIIIVLLPVLLFSIYQIFIASPRFESQAQVIVQQPESIAAIDPSIALLGGLGVQPSSSDTELVRAFIYSNDMLTYLDELIGLREHYQSKNADFFTRLKWDANNDELLKYYKKFIRVEVDEKSGVVSVFSQAFEPKYSQKITEAIVTRAEWYINSIGHQLAEAQLKFVRGEHQIIEDKLNKAQTELLNFQQQHLLLDPMAEGAALQQIAYTLEGEIASKKAELIALKSTMSGNSPQVVRVKSNISALQNQLKLERDKLALDTKNGLPVSQVLAQYTDLKIKMDLALQAYTASQISLDKTRTEAYRKIKFLVMVETATLPEEYRYPNELYNIVLFFVVITIFYFISSIVLSTLRELKS
ncbi:lipopolysaccharide biosynthesis protein [Vibrio sp. F13]|uniref:lipopolysaccharide biosynthesis protein n=1 Tax=Vibrio sp. F13 TaxID=2070777 RepID=UPI0010BD98E6|nr:lipopolysaccharide biosynthesis protein [Vibrio sp. F13]TKF67361.1 lipopolysaccharide biosynthesis protein [Vibrio sp. F13]